MYLKLRRKEKKFYDSDTVSLISNLANLRFKEKEGIRDNIKKNIKRILDRGYRDEFNDLPAIQRLLQSIRMEKPHFTNDISPRHLAQLFCVIPKQNNKRIIAQTGAFIIFGLSKRMSKQTMIKHIPVERITIASGSKSKIIKELDQINVNERVIFPEIEKASRYISQRYQ